LGTSGPKTALISVYGEVVDSEFQDTSIIYFPMAVRSRTRKVGGMPSMSTAKKIIGKKTCSPDDIVAISVTSQWSGTVPVDREGNT